jgi:FkbM family methyltransferase
LKNQVLFGHLHPKFKTPIMYLIIKFVFWLNLFLRRNPARFLYTDAMLGKFLDEPEADFFKKNLGKAVIWDVGASVGKLTTIMAKSSPEATIHAFEPNLNSLYFLAYRTAAYKNVIIVPCALTTDGKPLMGTYDPDFNAPPTGPRTATISVSESIAKTGVPQYIKMDIEGAEYDFFESPESEKLRQTTILVSWHPMFTKKSVPTVKGWKNTPLATNLTLLTPL